MYLVIAMVLSYQGLEERAAKPSAPKTQAPVFALGYLDAERRADRPEAFPGAVGFFVQAPYHVFEKRGSYTVRNMKLTGRPRAHRYVMSTCVFETPDGKKISLDEAAKKFKKKHAAILLTMDEKLDPFFVEVLEGRVIVVRTPDRFVRGHPEPPKKTPQK